MNKKLGQEPAFPPDREMQELTPNCEGYHVGMSKRFYAACAAMQGILSNQDQFHVDNDNSSKAYTRSLCKDAYNFADELLKQENL